MRLRIAAGLAGGDRVVGQPAEGTREMDLIPWAVGLAVAALGLVGLVVLVNFGGMWMQARLAHAPIPMARLVGMWLRKQDMTAIVNTGIMAAKAGLEVSWDQLETHALAGGDVVTVIRALIAAKGGGLALDWNGVAAIDLEGRDVVETVRGMIAIQRPA